MTDELNTRLIMEDNISSLEAPRGINFRPLFRTAKRNIFLIAGIAGLVAGLGTWYSTLDQQPVYQSQFQLLVEPVTEEERSSTPSALTSNTADTTSLDYTTQILILRSPAMLREILQEVRREYPNYSLESLQQGLDIGQLGGSGRNEQSKIIEVRYQNGDPQTALFVSEIIAQEYLDYSLSRRISNIGEGVKFIDEQLPGLQQRVSELTAAQQQIKQNNNIISPETQGSRVFEESTAVNSEQLVVRQELRELRRLYDNLQQRLNTTPDEALEELTLRQEPNYQATLSRVKELNGVIAEQSVRFTPSNPQIEDLQETRANLRSLLDEESQRILGTSLSDERIKAQVDNSQSPVRTELLGQFVETNNRIELLEIREQSLGQNKAILDQQLQQFPVLERDYTDLQRQTDIARQTLDQLTLRKEALQVEIAQEQVPWELIAEPDLLKTPQGEVISLTERELPKNFMKFGALGLGLGFAIAFLLERGKNIFLSPEDIKDTTQLPLLGIVPVYQQMASFQGGYNDSETLNHLLSEGTANQKTSLPFVKSFYEIYTNIHLITAENLPSSLAICSTEAGDGKSTIALHLARTAALTGKKVLLVDGNLSSPQLHRVFELPNERGFGDLITYPNLATDEVIARSRGIDNLHILTSGSIKSSSLLASNRMPTLMEKFQREFDLVIYDTPYLENNGMANFLSAHSDGILLVVSNRKTKRSQLLRILDQLRDFQLPIVGVVVNQIPKRKQGSLKLEDFEQENLETGNGVNPETNSIHL